MFDSVAKLAINDHRIVAITKEPTTRESITLQLPQDDGRTLMQSRRVLPV